MVSPWRLHLQITTNVAVFSAGSSAGRELNPAWAGRLARANAYQRK
jgi:hypothetical protein